MLCCRAAVPMPERQLFDRSRVSRAKQAPRPAADVRWLCARLSRARRARVPSCARRVRPRMSSAASTASCRQSAGAAEAVPGPAVAGRGQRWRVTCEMRSFITRCSVPARQGKLNPARLCGPHELQPGSTELPWPGQWTASQLIREACAYCASELEVRNRNSVRAVLDCRVAT